MHKYVSTICPVVTFLEYENSFKSSSEKVTTVMNDVSLKGKIPQ